MDSFHHVVIEIFEAVTLGIELLGVVVIVGGFIWAFYHLVNNRRKEPEVNHYHPFKKKIGRVLLLGLEILVAADIVETISLEMTIETVAVLGLLVLVRTFLSWTLILEVEGRWPWQREELVEQMSDEGQ